jgi:hypothetical protein
MTLRYEVSDDDHELRLCSSCSASNNMILLE